MRVAVARLGFWIGGLHNLCMTHTTKITYHFARERRADDDVRILHSDVLLHELALGLLLLNRRFGHRHGDHGAAGLDSLAGLGAEGGLWGL